MGGWHVYINNTIVAFNHAEICGDINLDLYWGSLNIGCSDFYDNTAEWVGACFPYYPGIDGNIAADPLFCDLDGGDLTIDENSPCAPGHSGLCGLIGAMPAGCQASAMPETLPLRAESPVAVVPNPARVACRIQWDPSAVGEVEVFSAAGRLVRRLTSERSRSGVAIWDLRDAAGASVRATTSPGQWDVPEEVGLEAPRSKPRHGFLPKLRG